MQGYYLETQDISELNELLITEKGLITPVHFDILNQFPTEMLCQFCHENGVYQIPTVELIQFLKKEIDGKPALEVGAGNGCIGRALNINMVDSHLQEQESMKQYYGNIGQPIVKYGPDVRQNDGLRAIKLYKPHTVIGCWITNKKPGGLNISDIAGMEEALFFKNGVKKYIHVGNEPLHLEKPLLKTHLREKIYAPWLLSRNPHKENNVIYIFEK